ncbi:Uncharacterized protein TCM_019524 [Theobroma cacao]|uniref:Uncharacterized protein n=1 Tax=Theobroma cacao TaxID=3641 RepID=A0A061EIN9_THECC|nr:Uncharacterized protein TCM_019524 [Theobroma cacao]
MSGSILFEMIMGMEFLLVALETFLLMLLRHKMGHFNIMQTRIGALILQHPTK